MQKRRKTDAKLRRIMSRACGLFAKKGFHNSSVRDVAAATGASPAGLYYYFRSKEELLHLILSDCLSSLLERVQREVENLRDPAKRLRAIVRAHLVHLESQRKEMRVLVHEWEALSGPYAKEIRGLMREYTRIVTGTFRDLHPNRPPEELRAATFGLFGMLTWVDQWYRPDRDLPLELLAEQFSAIFLGDFSPRAVNGARNTEVNGEVAVRERDRTNSTKSILSGPGF